ncbi:MAG: DNA ligase D, partial [Flavobacteriaceae bacterium]
ALETMAKRADTLLEEYRERRDFSRTAEPAPGRARRRGKGPLSFVVQKHDATRLHYDFRLEWDGVLKSWAVTRGPSDDPRDKRLAVRTEDHPLAYGDFEGTIPKGQYGGGTVMLWDRGTWEPEGDPAEGLRDGKLAFTLDGRRLKGRWSLVRVKPRRGEKRENWLLIKADDRHAGSGDALEKTRSVKSNRSMRGIAAKGRKLAPTDLAQNPAKGSPGKGSPGKQSSKKEGKARAKPAFPRFRKPQLATLVGDAPEGGEWLAEMKYDGYRAEIAVAGGRARIFTRSGRDWTEKFPAIARAAAALDVDSALLDGEIVAFNASGRTDFSSLQKALGEGGDEGAMACFVFDLLEMDGRDIAKLPLRERKEILAGLISGDDAPLLYSEHVGGHAAETFDKLCSAGHEGIVAKRADRAYRGGRGRDWLKVKCTRRQEFVIGGWSPSDKQGRPFASLLLGVNDKQGLVYKGRVGSGFGEAAFERLAPLLHGAERKSSPFVALPAASRRGVRFVTPKLVAEIDFAEFTADGHVRHGVFKGLRSDKDAGDVVLESPKGEKAMAERSEVAGIRLSHPGKVLFEAQGITKADLAAYYEQVAERMLPLVGKRLLSLVRCPEGAGEACFFQKHESKGMPGALKSIEIAESDGKKGTYLYLDSPAGLIAGVQMGTLEFHIWGSRIDDIERPDRVVFDLDPDPAVGFAGVKRAAFDLRALLKEEGLETVPLLTGGKGIHVVAPAERRADWDRVKAFASDIAKRMAATEPDRFVAKSSKAARKGRIFIDYLRNDRGATAIAPYSTRAREGCPVAMPVPWDELEGVEKASEFGIADALARLGGRDPWQDANWRQSVRKG